MAEIKISQLPAGDEPAGDELVPVVQGGATKRVALGKLKQGQNLLIGGNFTTNPFQRGSATLNVPASGTYIADRWRIEYDGAPTITRDVVDMVVGSRVLGTTIRKGLKLTVVNKAAATYIRLGQRMEGLSVVAGDDVVLSSAVQANRNVVLPVRVVQCFGTGGAPSANVVTNALQDIAATANLTEAFTALTVPSIAGKSYGTTASTDYTEIQYDLSNLATGDYIIIPLAKLEKGRVPTLFEYVHPAEVRALCQRFYETASFAVVQGSAGSAIPGTNIPYHVTKRVLPALSIKSSGLGTAGKWTNFNGGGDMNNGPNTWTYLDSCFIGPANSISSGYNASCFWMADAEL